MNAAFRRGEAITRLENYSPVILEHLALVTWFPHEQHLTHWNLELDAFLKTLRRYNRGKGANNNFSEPIIVETLMSFLETNDDRDALLLGVQGRCMLLPENPDWVSLNASLHDFARRLMAASPSS